MYSETWLALSNSFVKLSSSFAWLKDVLENNYASELEAYREHQAYMTRTGEEQARLNEEARQAGTMPRQLRRFRLSVQTRTAVRVYEYCISYLERLPQVEILAFVFSETWRKQWLEWIENR